jgi:hypothetical protein
VPCGLRGQLGCVGRVLTDVRRRDGDSHIRRVNGRYCWWRDVLCDVRRRGHGHIDADVQHGAVSRGLRGQLGRVGRVLSDVRRWNA